MTAGITLAAIAVSLLAIAYLSATDPKRRRSFKLQPHKGRRHVITACLLAFAPGFALLISGQSAAFVMWLGTVSLLGWLLILWAPASRNAPRAGPVIRDRNIDHSKF